MKLFTKIMVGLLASSFIPSVWALATKFDPTIYEREIYDIGFDDVELIKSDLRLRSNESVVVKHVLTPGEKRASCENIVLEINQLESITPRLNAYEMFNADRPVLLTDEQVNSLTKSFTNHKDKEWLNDRNTKKYIQIVLMKTGQTNGNTSTNGATSKNGRTSTNGNTSVQQGTSNGNDPMNSTHANGQKNGERNSDVNGRHKNKTFSALTTKDAKKLVEWAIKNKKIVEEDHNIKTAQ
ncbi:MAG TPA: hypothetical protein VFP93_02020 [Gammaproteobacteria bacterium]|nr:hypothetical protein [Gammaproteobacteria bacterium]